MAKERRKERRSRGKALESFVREYTAGLKGQEVGRLFREDAARAYAVLARDRPAEPEPKGRLRRLLHRGKVLFLGVSYKLSPPRRLLFAISLLAAVLAFTSGPIVFERTKEFRVEVNPSLFWAAVAIVGLVYLLAVELVDRVLIRDELEVARNVQRDLIPSAAPAVAGYRIAHSYRTANEVGGDFYDFVPLADGRLVVAVGDASGHGMAAGLVMAVSSATFRAALDLAPDPAEIARLIHGALLRRGASRSFLTFFALLLDPATGAFRWLDAGHPYPLLFHPGGAIEEVGAPALPLGVRAASAPATGDARLGAGDLLVLYSDGLVEARGADDAPFGEQRLRKLVALGGTAQEIHDRIRAAVAAFLADRPLDDDLTLVVLERLAADAT